MHKILGLALLGSATLAAPALAQSGDRSWSGVYAGGSIGVDFPERSGSPVVFDTNRDGTFGDTVRTGAGADAFSPGFCGGAANGVSPAQGCRTAGERLGYSGHIGIDTEIAGFVVGAVGEVGQPGVTESVSAFSTTPANYVFTRSIDLDAAARARVGYAFGDTLPYVTGGISYARVDHDFRSSNTANSFAVTRADRDAWGWNAGAGIEQRVAENFSIGLLYKYTRVRTDPTEVAVGRGTAPATNPFLLVNSTGTDMSRSDRDLDWHSARVTASFRF